MKYIVKKSVAELPAIQGSISDTTNITDKTKNTYSARVIEELAGANTTSSIEIITTTGTETLASVTQGNNAISHIELTNEGYMPIGVAGYNTGSKLLSCFRVYIESSEEGKCTVNMATRAIETVSNITVTVYVSWIKIK